MALFTPTLASIIEDAEFGLGLLTSFGPKVDIIGVYAGTGSPGAQVFAKARPMKATVRETSKIMEYPVETGQTFSDFHVINPVEIELPMVVTSKNYAATYAAIRQNFLNASPLSVKTRTGVYKNMIIVDMPHEEDPEMFTAIIIAVRMRQVLQFSPGTTQVQSNYSPLSALNSNTLASGLQSASAIGFTLLGAVGAVASYAALAKRL